MLNAVLGSLAVAVGTLWAFSECRLQHNYAMAGFALIGVGLGVGLICLAIRDHIRDREHKCNPKP